MVNLGVAIHPNYIIHLKLLMGYLLELKLSTILDENSFFFKMKYLSNPWLTGPQGIHSQPSSSHHNRGDELRVTLFLPAGNCYVWKPHVFF